VPEKVKVEGGKASSRLDSGLCERLK